MHVRHTKRLRLTPPPPCPQVVFAACDATRRVQSVLLVENNLLPTAGAGISGTTATGHELAAGAKALQSAWRYCADMAAKVARCWTAQRLKVRILLVSSTVTWTLKTES